MGCAVWQQRWINLNTHCWGLLFQGRKWDPICRLFAITLASVLSLHRRVINWSTKRKGSGWNSCALSGDVEPLSANHRRFIHSFPSIESTCQQLIGWVPLRVHRNRCIGAHKDNRMQYLKSNQSWELGRGGGVLLLPWVWKVISIAPKRKKDGFLSVQGRHFQVSPLWYLRSWIYLMLQYFHAGVFLTEQQMDLGCLQRSFILELVKRLGLMYNKVKVTFVKMVRAECQDPLPW